MNAVVSSSLNELMTRQLIYRHTHTYALTQSCLVIQISFPVGEMLEVILLTLRIRVHCFICSSFTNTVLLSRAEFIRFFQLHISAITVSELAHHMLTVHFHILFCTVKYCRYKIKSGGHLPLSVKNSHQQRTDRGCKSWIALRRDFCRLLKRWSACKCLKSDIITVCLCPGSGSRHNRACGRCGGTLRRCYPYAPNPDY